jgi:hypothetical protein
MTTASARRIGCLNRKSIAQRASHRRVVAIGAARFGEHAAVRGLKRHLLYGRQSGKPIQRVDHDLPGRLKIERT